MKDKYKTSRFKHACDDNVKYIHCAFAQAPKHLTANEVDDAFDVVRLACRLESTAFRLQLIPAHQNSCEI